MLGQIRIFSKIVELGSFSKAGTVLNMAPSSVARSLDKLEAELGVTLFKRSTRTLALTDEGRAFLAGAERLLEDADQLVASLQQQPHQPEGTLKISAFESFGRLCIAPLLPEFLARYPKLKVQLELENRVVDLASENVDLGVRIGRPADSSLQARRLLPNETLLCAAPSYLERRGTPHSPEELAQHNCLLLSQQRQRNYWHFYRDGEHRKVAVQGNLSSLGGTPLVEAAVHGGGLILMSRWMLTELMHSGKLVECLPEWRGLLHERSSGDIYLVWPGQRYLRPALRLLIDFLAERISEDGVNSGLPLPTDTPNP